MRCAKCHTEIGSDDSYEHAGQALCEDCYLDVVAVPKTCDPWAVYSAKNTVPQGDILTAEQQRIMDLLKAKGPVTLNQICTELGIGEEEFRRDFATLRHMEVARGCKVAGEVCFAVFDESSADSMWK